MSKDIALASNTTVLVFSMSNEDCTFAISDDRTLITLVKGKDLPIRRIILELTDTAGNEMQNYVVVCGVGGRKDSVRIDAIVSTVFEDAPPDSTIIDAVYSDYHLSDKDYKTFNLEITLEFSGSKRDLPTQSVCPIATENIFLDNSTVPVSKEALELCSEYFAAIFNIDLEEKKTGEYRIAEDPAMDYRWFIHSAVYRMWEISTIEDLKCAFKLADYFAMPYVYKRIAPFLKSVPLSEKPAARIEQLKELLELTSKTFGRQQSAAFIFKRCQSSRELTVVANSQQEMMNHFMKEFFETLQAKQQDEQIASNARMEWPQSAPVHSFW